VLGVQDDRIVTTELFAWRAASQSFEATGLAPVNHKLKFESDSLRQARSTW
jgi:hypothetical protein